LTSSDRVLVIDASVAVKLVLPEEYADQAELAFSLLEADPPWEVYVPEFFYLECANVFRSRVKRRGMTPDQARQAFAVIRAFPLRVVPTADLSTAALDLALEYDLSVYDACYLAAAAVGKGARLATADRKFVEKLADTPYSVTWIGEKNWLEPHRRR